MNLQISEPIETPPKSERDAPRHVHKRQVWKAINALSVASANAGKATKDVTMDLELALTRESIAMGALWSLLYLEAPPEEPK